MVNLRVQQKKYILNYLTINTYMTNASPRSVCSFWSKVHKVSFYSFSSKRSSRDSKIGFVVAESNEHTNYVSLMGVSIYSGDVDDA